MDAENVAMESELEGSTPDVLGLSGLRLPTDPVSPETSRVRAKSTRVGETVTSEDATIPSEELQAKLADVMIQQLQNFRVQVNHDMNVSRGQSNRIISAEFAAVHQGQVKPTAFVATLQQNVREAVQSLDAQQRRRENPNGCSIARPTGEPSSASFGRLGTYWNSCKSRNRATSTAATFSSWSA